MGGLVKVLSIDGGGIRGIIPAVVLIELERRTGRPISELFDLVAGTSTGGILGLGLTLPSLSDPSRPRYSARDMLDLYEKQGPRIFKRKLLGGTLIGAVVGDEKYPSDGIESVLESYFGEARLADALTDVVISAYETYKRTPFFFKSAKARGVRARRAPAPPMIDNCSNFRVRDAARATSAAPTYFEPKRLPVNDPSDINVEYSLIDGGVYLNNPAISAYIEARKMFPEADDVLVVSLGTGSNTRPYRWDQVKDWSLVEWVRPVLNIMMDGQSDATDYQLALLLNGEDRIAAEGDKARRYFRFDRPLEMARDDMDDVSPVNLRALKEVGQMIVRDNADRLAALSALLVSQGDESGPPSGSSRRTSRTSPLRGPARHPVTRP